MADELTPITRLEGILAGQDITPITRLEHFLKQYAGGGGGSGGGVLVVNVTEDSSTGKLVCDKTAAEMFTAYLTGIVLLRVTDVKTEMITVTGVAIDETAHYTFLCYSAGIEIKFTATSGDSYPQASM